MSLLHFPSQADARVASELRVLCRDFALTGEQSTRVLSKFLRTVNEGRSNGVATMEARRVMRSFETGCSAQDGAA